MSAVETSAEGRAVESEQYHERQRRKRQPKELKSWYEAVGQKVVKKTQSETGHVYSVHVGKLKDCEHLVNPGKKSKKG